MTTKRQPVASVVVAALLGGALVGLFTTKALQEPVCGLVRPQRDARRGKKLPCADHMVNHYKFSIC